MYFEIDNTPEHIRRARRTDTAYKEVVKEECPRLVLAPFSRPPQVVFDNVLIGTSCERSLEIFNPSKQFQQITLGKSLPHGLIIHLPGEWLVLEPETCYCVNLLWAPNQPTAVRETIRFTNENRGRYDVIVVLKSVVNITGKGVRPKGFKISPGKIKKKPSKKSPVTIYKKKTEAMYNTTQIKKTYNIIQTQQKTSKVYNKENDYFSDSHVARCPFGSPNSVDLNFDTSEIFANMRKPDILQQTYDKSYTSNTMDVPNNVLKPSNRQFNISGTDIFDNLTFTPLKIAKADKLDKVPKKNLTMNSESDLDDSLDMCNKENQTHSILSITSSQPPNKWATVNHHTETESNLETPNLQTKKHPNTSSPKDLNSPNFSINTEFSRISDLSFFPQRVSTEKKCFQKLNNETHEFYDDSIKVSTDTFTKESPHMRMEPYLNVMYEMRAPNFFLKEQPKMCRQALFKDQFQQQREIIDSKKDFHTYEHNVWQNDLRNDVRSPPRSITPPLQSIPEESVQLSDTQNFDRTNQQNTFTINRTFDKTIDRYTFTSANKKQSWSKKSIRAEPDLWKIPITHIKKTAKNKSLMKSKDSLCNKTANKTFETDKSIIQNMSVNQIGNIYSQSATVDPFMSTTYFYDEEAVDKFETEFKRWLNCILTPPADLDSNIEMKIDVGKAWIENRNKEVPAAPTKEQVSSAYHNSHRLESLRRTARSLLMSPEISQVIQKLNAQIEKKLIAIRNDRNLHLDIGLQKAIMELLLSYNPLWLRIGLEAIYGLVLPLKSNSDIEGLTTFIIQRMFKNPFLKNKHSKSSAPNMLLPAYMDAIKKFTLKKFFMLVFFLDQAKQRKLISHDPCLFCRNAVCKESREIVIRFTRELIAGIGDITKHLRPLGYIVCHKQSYLDEYKYAVHNIAVDIRDGVRLTKVMEIILMKDGLLNQLRTPAISRLQKIHNVQVALNALRDANFLIVGDISANDIADGHREKTLSLLWQIIRVFRAPLFEKAANSIQIWWRKKYEVIVEKRKEAERILQQQNTAASVIQCWWRRIQYNRLVEWKMQQVTYATIVIQKYCRKWLCRSRLLKMKRSVVKIEEWFRSIKRLRAAKVILETLRMERERLRNKSAVVIQSFVRRWLCMKQYQSQLKKIRMVQSIVRGFLVKKKYIELKKATLYIQKLYKGKLLMKKQMHDFNQIKTSAILIQSYYRMVRQRNRYLRLKHSVEVIEKWYIALITMRAQLNTYIKTKQSVIKIQALLRSKICRQRYSRQRDLLVFLQRKIRAKQQMKKEKESFLKLKQATVTIQMYFRSYFTMKAVRKEYVTLREATIKIQTFFRSYLLAKSQRNSYLQLRNATIRLQKAYRGLILMRAQRSAYLELQKSAIIIQRRYRAQHAMKKQRQEYLKLLQAAINIQHRYRALSNMKEQRKNYLKLKSSCCIIQNSFKAFKLAKTQRDNYVLMKKSANKIRNWYRNCKKTKMVEHQYQQSKQACVTIQRVYRAYILGRKQRLEYIRIKTATIRIQKYYRSYTEMKIVRKQFIQLKTSTVTIQRYYKSYLVTKKQRAAFILMKNAANLIKLYYKNYRYTKSVQLQYIKLKQSTVCIQKRYRAMCAMRSNRNNYLKLKHLVTLIQQKYRALLVMRKDRQVYLQTRSAVCTIQTRYRAYKLMESQKNMYKLILKSSITIQMYYRAYIKGKQQRNEYLQLKKSSIVLQNRYRALLTMRRDRNLYLTLKTASINIQRRYRAYRLMTKQKSEFTKTLNACITIQRAFKAYLCGKQQRKIYINMKLAAQKIQRYYRLIKETRRVQNDYQNLRNAVLFVQRRFRYNKVVQSLRQNLAAIIIQNWYIAAKKRATCRQEFLKMKKCVIVIQSLVRMRILRKRFVTLRNASVCMQRYYRAYKLKAKERRQYLLTRIIIIKLQSHVRCLIERKRFLKWRQATITIQTAYRLKKQRDTLKIRRQSAAICLQKYVRRYLVRSRYLQLQNKVTLIQNIWRGKLRTRLTRCEFLQKRRSIVQLQAILRGYLVRKHVQTKREDIKKIREEKRLHWAASKIQALCRGHIARVNIAHDERVAELRRRWRDGGLQSTQESMKQRNEEVIWVLRNTCDIETVIKAFKSFQILTEVFPMIYSNNASAIVHRVYIYMSATNRSISSVEILKSAAAALVNLTRYKVTGPKIYMRERILPILKFMWRFSNSETQLFCIMATYLWLFSKYECVKKDLAEFLKSPENHRMLVTIKGNVERSKRMSTTIMRNKLHTPHFTSTHNHSSNSSVCSYNSSWSALPALEPDYGIERVDKPRYFEDAQQAIDCLLHTYQL